MNVRQGRVMRRLVMVAVLAGVAVGVFATPSLASASSVLPIQNCGDIRWHGHVLVQNITARGVTCRRARDAANHGAVAQGNYTFRHPTTAVGVVVRVRSAATCPTYVARSGSA